MKYIPKLKNNDWSNGEGTIPIWSTAGSAGKVPFQIEVHRLESAGKIGKEDGRKGAERGRGSKEDEEEEKYVGKKTGVEEEEEKEGKERV